MDYLDPFRSCSYYTERTGGVDSIRTFSPRSVKNNANDEEYIFLVRQHKSNTTCELPPAIKNTRTSKRRPEQEELELEELKHKMTNIFDSAANKLIDWLIDQEIPKTPGEVEMGKTLAAAILEKNGTERVRALVCCNFRVAFMCHCCKFKTHLSSAFLSFLVFYVSICQEGQGDATVGQFH